MTTQPNADLLPTGQTLDLRGQPLHIARIIGSGATSEVYLGTLGNGADTRKVVIKAMKPLEFAGALSYFRGEATTLAQLPGLETQHNGKRGLPLDYHVAPQFFGRHTYDGGTGQGVEYLVMDFIEGRQVPDLLAEAPDGRLPEAQALTLGFQLFHTLDLLHTHLKKSYIDLKFENLWWEVLPGGGGRLRMTDFGTLEDIVPGNDRSVRRDLVVAATYLCKMLTGIMPSHTAGELRGNQVPQIQRVQDISLGSRQLLARLLHPNAAARPHAAADVLDPGPPRTSDAPDLSALVGLMHLADYWTRPVDSLVTIKDSVWAKGADAQGASRLTLLARARVVLDIWARRNPLADKAQVASEREQLDRLVQQSDNLANGIALFRAGSDSPAETFFAGGRAESYEPERIALFRRWGYAARLARAPGISLSDDDRQDIERALDLMGQGNWSAAEAQLRQLQPRLGQADAYALLAADLALYSALDRAAAPGSDPTAAVRAYDDALTALGRLPQAEQEAILRDETGRLLPERDRLDEIARTRQAGGFGAEAMAKAREAFNSGEFPKAYQHARQAFAAEEPAALPQRQRDLTKLVDDALAAGRYDVAAGLASVALVGRRDSAALRRQWQLAHDLEAAQRDLELGELPRFVARVDTLGRGDGAPLGKLLAAAIHKAKSTHDANLLHTLAGLSAMPAADRSELTRQAQSIDATWQANAEESARRQRERNKPVVEEALLEVERLLFVAGQTTPRPDFTVWSHEKYLLALNDPRATLQEAYDQAVAAKAQAQRVGHRLEDADRLLSRVKAAQTELDQTRQQVSRVADRNSDEAAQTRARLSELANSLSPPTFDGDREAQMATARELLLGSSWYLTTVNAQDNEVLAYYGRAVACFNYLRPQGWEGLKEEADKHLQGFHDALAAADEAFERGETHRNGALLSNDLARYEGTPEAAAFRQRQERALEWRNFADRFANRPATPYQPEPLHEVRRRLPRGLPAAFWANSAAAAWLGATANAAAAEAQQKMGLTRQPLSAGPSRPASAWSSGGVSPGGGPSSGYDYAATDATATDAFQPPAGRLNQGYSPYGGAATNGGRGPEGYLTLVQWWFDADQTQRLAAANAPDAAPDAAAAGWSAAAFLDAAAAAAQAGDFAALQRVVQSAPPVADIDRALSELSPDLWRQALRRRPPESVYDNTYRETRPARPRWMWPAIGGAAALLVVLLALGIIYRDRLGLLGGPRPTPTVIVQSTATLGGGRIVPTATNPSLPTVAPTAPPLTTPRAPAPLTSPTTTLTPTVAFTPTPTATAPPPEASAFYQPDPAAVQPPPPVSDATLWLIGVAAAEVQPPLDGGLWLPTNDELTGDFLYIEDFTNPVSLTWRHDQPLAEGLYQIYALDTAVRSRGTQRFEVRFDDQPVKPFRGQSEVTFGFADGGQRQATWLPIGAYAVATGQRLSVHVSPSADSPVFAVPALLVARLGDRERELLTALPDPSLGRPLVALLDDENTERYTGSGDPFTFKPGSTQWAARTATAADASQPAPLIWNGRYQAVALNPVSHVALRAEWLPVGRQPAGQYQLWAYVPAGSTALVEYQILADGAPLTPAIKLDQAQHAGQWIDIGLWDLPTEARVSVYATVTMAGNQPGATAGVDAVALLQVGK